MSKKLPKLLVTGGAGFIGSEFVRQGVQRGYPLAVVDKLTYAGDLTRLDLVRKEIRFYKMDIANANLESVIKKERPDCIVHFAAETHVDRSIQDARPFIQTNVNGTLNLVNLARKYGVEKFIHISTDEVYGEIKKGKFTEESKLHPNNPYSATKASADFMVMAAQHTFGFPAIIVRPSNNYGPWQYPEKFIPVIVLKAKRNNRIPVYGKGDQIREWLYVADSARAIMCALERGKIGEVYNVGSNMERKNIQTVKTVLKLLGKPESLIEFVQDRPGHDFRYSLSCKKIQALGWRPEITFEVGIQRTLRWADENFDWLEGKLKYLQNYWKKVYKKKS